MSKAKPMDDQKRIWSYLGRKYPHGILKECYQTLEELLTPRQRRRVKQKRCEG